MSLDSVRTFFAEHAPDIAVIVTEEVRQQWRSRPPRMASSPADRQDDLPAGRRARRMLVVASGTARSTTGNSGTASAPSRACSSADEVLALPAIRSAVSVPLACRRRCPSIATSRCAAFDEVVPAAGATNAAVRLSPRRLAALTAAEWVDVCI